MTQRCTVCQVAPILEHDRHCFYCGAQLLGIRLTLTREYVMVGGEREATEGIEAWIENTGQLPQRVQLAASAAPWMSFRNVDDTDPPPTSWTLAPMSKAAFRIHVTPDLSLHDALEATVLVEGDGDVDDRSKRIRVLPPIRATVVWQGSDTLYMIESTLPELQGEILIESAVPVTVKSCSTDKTKTWASLERDGENGSFRVQVDRARLRAELGESRPGNIALPIDVVLDDKLPPVQAVSLIQLEWPAQLVAVPVRHQPGNRPGDDDALLWNAPSGRLHLLDIDVVNRGGRQVVVHDVRVADPENRSYLAERSLLDLPIVISPGAEVRLRIAVDLTGECPGVIVPTMTADTDDLEAPTQSWDLRIQAFSVPGTNLAAGLDFGTTNSCLAVWRSDEPEVGFLAPGLRSLGEQPNRIQATVRSNAVYHHRISDSLRTCEIGVTDKDAKPIEGVKRDLAQGASERVCFKDDHQRGTLTSEDIARDIIRELIAGAEDVLGGKLESCAVTHPVNFGHEELAILRDAFERTGVRVDLLLPEPVAAAFEFAVTQGRNFDIGDGRTRDLGALYSILVIDIGGGTTDIAVVEVHDDEQPRDGILRGRIITPRLLGVRGLRWTGGEDITWAMVERKLVNGNTESDTGDVLNVADEVRRRILMRERKARREYRTQLFEPAEDEKINPSTLLTTFAQTKEEIGEIAEAFVREHEIVDLCRQTLQDAGLTTPDVLLLVGQTWAIPRLREIIEEEFEEVPIFPSEQASAENLKKSVALGACRAALFGREFLGYTLVWDPKELETLSSTRLGMLQADSTTGKLRFHTLIHGGRNSMGQPCRVKLSGAERGGKITLLRNSGVRDDLRVEVNGVLIDNPEIKRIGVVTIPPSYSENQVAVIDDDCWLVIQAAGEHVTDVHLEVNGKISPVQWAPVKRSQESPE